MREISKSTNLLMYNHFLRTCPAPIFLQDWWLDAVCGADGWDCSFAYKNDNVIAALPFQKKTMMGMTILTTPPYTPFLGPVYLPGTARYARTISKEHAIHEALIQALPRHDVFSSTFSPAITNWQSFRWNGFKQTTNYTYIITGISNIDAVWKETEDSIRTDIRKAKSRYELVIEETEDIDAFLHIYAGTWKRQNKQIPFEDRIRALDSACTQRQCRRILLARDGKGQIHAGTYTVWDQDKAYYLLGGSDPDLRTSGAHTFAIWESICRAAQHVDTFDFEGSDIRPIERQFRSFGARQTPLLHIERMSPLIYFAKFLRDKLKR